MADISVKFGTPEPIKFREYDKNHPEIDLDLEVTAAGISVVTAYDGDLYSGDEEAAIKTGEIAGVEEAMMQVTEYANVGFYTYPASGNSGRSGESKARDWGNSVFGAGTRFTVFIIDMKTRHLDIWASESLVGTLTRAHSNTIADNVYRYASRGDYAGCAEETFAQIGRVLRGEKIATPMKVISNILLAMIVAILGTYLLVSARIRKEQAVSMPTVIRAAAAGTATVVTAQQLKKVVHHESHSGGGHSGGFGGGGGGGGGGGHGF